MKFYIEVSQIVEVDLDPSKFTPDFLEEFRLGFYDFTTIEEHAEHIAQLQARGVIDLEATSEFIEGYGPSAEMGIAARISHTEMVQMKLDRDGRLA